MWRSKKKKWLTEEQSSCVNDRTKNTRNQHTLVQHPLEEWLDFQLGDLASLNRFTVGYSGVRHGGIRYPARYVTYI